MMLSGSAVQVKGFGLLLVSATKRLMAAWSSTTERKTPRVNLRREIRSRHDHESPRPIGPGVGTGIGGCVRGATGCDPGPGVHPGDRFARSGGRCNSLADRRPLVRHVVHLNLEHEPHAVEEGGQLLWRLRDQPGLLSVVDDAGRERERYKIPYGAVINAKDGESVEAGAILATWDPHTHPVITEVAGVA